MKGAKLGALGNRSVRSPSRVECFFTRDSQIRVDGGIELLDPLQVQLSELDRRNPLLDDHLPKPPTGLYAMSSSRIELFTNCHIWFLPLPGATPLSEAAFNIRRVCSTARRFWGRVSRTIIRFNVARAVSSPRRANSSASASR